MINLIICDDDSAVTDAAEQKAKAVCKDCGCPAKIKVYNDSRMLLYDIME